MAIPPRKRDKEENTPCAREDERDNKLPNGDIRRACGDAANEGIVTSRDQAQQRVRDARERSATATHGRDRID
jgi:hypothetical protein